ncbi:hypothetical protein RDI58_015258 [Solanum bulbocastanum]|uniref:superoxide dismutase n=1 Tax=Solanum bulbocastanum TaxID=147425 RepID=A0AAN8YEU2_SOLBU
MFRVVSISVCRINEFAELAHERVFTIRCLKSIDVATQPEAGGEPLKGSLGWAIDTCNFGSLKTLVKKMNAEGAALQGGRSHFLFLWLAVDKKLKRLLVETTANQDYLHSPPPWSVSILLSTPYRPGFNCR